MSYINNIQINLDEFLFSRCSIQIETYKLWNYQRRNCFNRFVNYTFKYMLTVFNCKIYIERKTIKKLFQYYTLPVKQSS